MLSVAGRRAPKCPCMRSQWDRLPVKLVAGGLPPEVLPAPQQTCKTPAQSLAGSSWHARHHITLTGWFTYSEPYNHSTVPPGAFLACQVAAAGQGFQPEITHLGISTIKMPPTYSLWKEKTEKIPLVPRRGFGECVV